MVALLALTPFESRAEPTQVQNGGDVVVSKGLRERILDGKLRRTTLVLGDSSVTVVVRGEVPKRFRYDTLRVRRGRHHLAPPFRGQEFWWEILPQLPLQLATGGVGSGAVYLGTTLGVGHLLDTRTNRCGKRSLTLWSSRDDDRYAHLVLPRRNKLRLAILD